MVSVTPIFTIYLHKICSNTLVGKILERTMKIITILCIFIITTLTTLGVEKVAFKTVVIDAGHGGKDPGACGKVVQEKVVALSVALKLGELIKARNPEVKVIYTRSTDVFVPLDERAKIANKNKADLFISIHANMISNPATRGVETFVLGLHRTDDNLEVAKKENSVIVMEDDYSSKYEGFDPNLSESYIIFELVQNVFLDQSISIASAVQHEFATQIKRHDRGVKQAGFLVLRQTAMPSVLIETGFLSNKEEEKYLASDKGQGELSEAIYKAFLAYKNKFEAKSNIKIEEQIQEETAVATSTDVTYKVQIASSVKKLNKTDFPINKFKKHSYYEEGGRFKYTVDSTKDILVIKKSLEKTKKIVKDAFIVGFDSEGNKLSNTKLKKLIQ